MRISAVVPAAGRGKRLREKSDKAFVLLDKKPILFYTLKNLERIKDIEEIILVVSRRSLQYTKEIFLKKFNFKKRIKVVKGGPTRSDSVWNGLREIDKTKDLVLIHDGARPFIDEDLLKMVINEGRKFEAVVPGIPLNFTVKEIKNHLVVRTLPRQDLWEIQTPQFFKKDLLISCYKKARKERFIATDDAQVVERYGHKVRVIKGSPLNIKITTPEDLVLAKAILRATI
ncbi:MAG: 2-C-methyl-D-erythritol 4-phosphate cytidylyltransferase [Candidatus Omnitrophica bacterium]|nr:2-C-methyl-D-erythritol 4-phosphate cytidylyltransferase [Candidatus Omnitrophota bacterium]MCM8793672.1 2-C-methyl-D-erythritol 4-phosphate cytidylyltransferase [Candidatus Omnitrophota bacterium]